MRRKMSSFAFDNALLRKLPIQEEIQTRVQSKVSGVFFSRVMPTPVKNPKLVIASNSALQLVGLSPHVPFLCGNEIIPGSEPAAHCYCGHQFGYFSGQLGDGATMYLGEIVDENAKRWELQLKGAGKTPYSRTADGRKVLRSSLREFLASEHMHALGIPTTRAGSVVTSETKVLRDIFYNGNAKYEPAAVITRIAPSFLRFGSFEIFKPTDRDTGRAGPSSQVENKQEFLENMLNYVISTYFPDIPADMTLSERGLLMYRDIVESTARLVAQWQVVGFCHGVLNTDNMSLLGLTIDYGPFGFMEHFNPDFVCNASDEQGRYAYKRQPEMCRWNLSVFADQLRPVIDSNGLNRALDSFDTVYQCAYRELTLEKLGFQVSNADDEALIDAWWTVLKETGADLTCSFRCLSKIRGFGAKNDSVLDTLVQYSSSVQDLRRQYAPKLPRDFMQQIVSLATRNQSVEAVCKAVAGQMGIPSDLLLHEYQIFQQLSELENLSDTQLQEKNRSLWKAWLEKYVVRLESEVAQDAQERRAVEMNRKNPCIILRNYIAQQAIDYAEAGRYDQVERVFEALVNPYDDSIATQEWQQPQPADTSSITVT